MSFIIDSAQASYKKTAVRLRQIANLTITADAMFLAFDVEMSGVLTVANSVVRATNISIVADSVVLNGAAAISASGMGPATPNVNADTMLGPDGQIYGAGGGGAGGVVRLLSSVLSQLPNSVMASTSAGQNPARTDCVGNPGSILSDAPTANRTRFLCRGGTFDDGVMFACQACAAGTSAEAPGSRSCTPCPLGTYANASTSGCVRCSPGSHHDDSDRGRCLLCPIGTEAPRPGAGECTKCGAGLVAPAEGTARCALPTPAPTPAPLSASPTLPNGGDSFSIDSLPTDSDSPIGIIVGAVVGGLVVIGLLAGVLICVAKRKRVDDANGNAGAGAGVGLAAAVYNSDNYGRFPAARASRQPPPSWTNAAAEQANVSGASALAASSRSSNASSQYAQVAAVTAAATSAQYANLSPTEVFGK